jgi:glycosyltransferase involved in cell wall biosynthesis
VSISVACLPVAGLENPYQTLMMEGLRQGGLHVYHGNKSKIFGIFKTGLKKPDYIHFDWETNYYQRRTWWMTLVNVPIFIIQVILVKYILRVKLVWTPHNVRPHDSRNIFLHRMCRRFFGSQMQWIRVFSSSTVSKLSEELKIDQRRFRVVPEGSYCSYYSNTISKEQARDILGLNIQTEVFLYMGYVKPYKGILEMIMAFKSHFDHAILIIAGKIMDEGYGLEVMANQSERIKVIDKFISEQDVQVYMNAADAVVLPFKNIENSGSVILAMGYEKVILAPAMGVINDRLSNQKHLLYRSEIAESFNAWKTLNIGEAEMIGRANRKALDEFDWKDFSKLFLS